MIDRKPPKAFTVAGIICWVILIITLILLPFYQTTLKYSYSPAALSGTLENATTSGFYKQQTDPAGNKYVWTVDRPSLNFDFYSAKPVKLVVLARSAAVAGGVDAPIKVLVNGEFITQFQPDPTRQDFQPFEFKLTSKGSSLYIQFVSTPFNASGDTRSLGFMVSEITLDKSEAWGSLHNRARLMWLVAALALLGGILRFIPLKRPLFIARFGVAALFATAAMVATATFLLLWVVGPVDGFFFNLSVVTLVVTVLLAVITMLAPKSLLSVSLSSAWHGNLKQLPGKTLAGSAFLLLAVILVSNVTDYWNIMARLPTTKYVGMSYQDRQNASFSTFAEGVSYANKLIPADATITVLLPRYLKETGQSFFFNYWLYPRRFDYEDTLESALAHNNLYLIYNCSSRMLSVNCPEPLSNPLDNQNRYKLLGSFDNKKEFFGIYRLKEAALTTKTKSRELLEYAS